LLKTKLLGNVELSEVEKYSKLLSIINNQLGIGKCDWERQLCQRVFLFYIFRLISFDSEKLSFG